MGYDTFLDGKLVVSPPFRRAHAEYLEAFAKTRRVIRDPVKAEALPDPLRVAVELPLGDEASLFVGGTGGSYGEEYDESVVDGNRPPKGQPGLWCDWKPSRDRRHLVPDDDCNRQYLEWLEYVLDTFIGPWGYLVNGRVRWQGDDVLDRGTIIVSENRIEAISDELAGFEKLELVLRQVDQFRELLTNTATEEEVHQFLKDGNALMGLTSTIDPISKFSLGNDFVTDFVIHDIPDGFVLVEIERPTLRLFNKPKKPGYPPERSRDFNHAIEQTETWQAWIGTNHSYVRQKLPGISPTPLCWLIAGRSTELTQDEMRQLRVYNEQHRHSLRVWTYDEFLARTETILRRLGGSIDG